MMLKCAWIGGCSGHNKKSVEVIIQIAPSKGAMTVDLLE